eukprot:CAMPEP_0182555718 /NCGR_PEP_ID=MMETSP1324-20130603/215_1 /TAXON_ID=236786 /ORGANISM="Florenciella sp., Strain RCC1587" /LENGTH=141 /DNA_ID=CAMNT_0024767495 /DNA_START=610 /DNA_END=1032 /DNA_ORIENTATION=-
MMGREKKRGRTHRRRARQCKRDSAGVMRGGAGSAGAIRYTHCGLKRSVHGVRIDGTLVPAGNSLERAQHAGAYSARLADMAERKGDRAEHPRLRGESALLGVCFDPSLKSVRTGPMEGGVVARLIRRLHRSARGIVRGGGG